MTPIIDDAPRLAVRSVDDALMRANHVALGHNHQPIRVNAQADRAVRKAGRHRITLRRANDPPDRLLILLTIKVDQAGRRDALSFLDKTIEHCGERHQRRLLSFPHIGDASRQGAMRRLCPQQLTAFFQPIIQRIQIRKRWHQ
jgi:hypothetical protein